MHPGFRLALFGIAAIQLLSAAAFALELGIATDLWPFPGTTTLTFILIASIFAAAAASTAWAAASGEDAALAGIGLDYVFIFGPLTAIGLIVGLRDDDGGILLFGLACIGGVVFGAGVTAWSIRRPLNPLPPTPRPVRWAFAVFVVLLLFVSARLFLQTKTIPWTLTDELSLVAAAMFLGAAVYFIYGFVRPAWSNAAGQLAGFLAYDLVLIGPFLARLPDVSEENRTGLVAYTAVVVLSGLLAAYYLFVNPETRLWGRRGARHGASVRDAAAEVQSTRTEPKAHSRCPNQ